MRAKNWYGSLIPNYLSTHPATDARIAYIDTWLQAEATRKPLPPPRRQHVFVRTRTRINALYFDEDLAKNTFKTALANTPDDPMAWYGWGLVQSRSGNRTEALRYLRMAADRFPLDEYIMADLGRACFLAGRYKEAIGILQSCANVLADDADVHFYLGRAYLAIDDVAPARLIMERLVEKHPKYYDAYFYLGKIYSSMRRTSDSHYYLAIYYFKAKQKFDTALHHLHKAQDATTDPEQEKKIESVMEEVREAEETAFRRRRSKR
jgi:predicted Zn-dependent protease